MEKLHTFLDNSKMYDDVLRDKTCLAETGDLTIITKHGAMKSGATGVMITFSVQLPDGSMAKAQACTSIPLLKAQLRILDTAYDNEGFPTVKSTVDDEPKDVFARPFRDPR